MDSFYHKCTYTCLAEEQSKMKDFGGYAARRNEEFNPAYYYASV